MAIAEQLARARSDSGFDQEDLASALGVSRAMVSYWEAGSRTPNDRQLVALSRLLRTPIAVLLGHEEPSPTPDVAAMLMRGADQELAAGDAHRGLREFAEFLDAYAELAEATGFTIRGMNESPFVSGAGYQSGDDVRRKAEEVRAHLRVGLGPIGDIDAVCELLGITVYRARLGDDLSHTISGAFFNHPVIGFSVLVNLDMTPGRRRFTVAHELAHALFHSKDSRYTVSTARKPPRERFADAFAGEFLMPTGGLRRVMEEQGFSPRIDDPSEVIHLQRYFDVSYVTALVRLRQAKYLTQASFEEFQRVRPVLLARSLGFEIGEEEYRPRPAVWRLERFPPRFRRLLRHAVRQGVISVPSASAMTGLSIDEVAELVAAAVIGDAPLGEELTEIKQYADSGVFEVA
jgi:Zn-dependent peptidase ImmA (M78 family)/DNA-binding XRE family transcriptional regulator